MNEQNKPKKFIASTLLGGKINRALTSIVLTLLIIFLLVKVSFIFSIFNSLLSLVVFPIVLTLILYYIMEPIVKKCANHKIPRALTISVLFLIFVGIIGIALWIIIPIIETQVTSFAKSLPHEIDQLTKQTKEFLNRPALQPIEAAIMTQISKIDQLAEKLGGTISHNAFSSIGNIFEFVESTLLGLLMTPFMLFYLLKDDEKLLPSIIHWVPTKLRKSTEEAVTEINFKFSSYIRGQLIIALLVTVVLTIAFAIIKLKYGFTLAIITGIMNFLVPSFGALIGAVPTVIVAFMQSPILALIVIVIFYVIQHLESHLVAPLVLSNKLDVHPLTILILLLWGGKAFGFVGLVLIIPLYAMIKVIVTHLFAWYRKNSPYYTDETPVVDEEKLTETK